MSKKRLNAFIKVSTILVALFFLLGIIGYRYHSTISTYATKQLFPQINPENFSYEHVGIENNAITLHNVHYFTSDYDIKSEAVEITLSRNPHGFVLSPSVNLINAVVTVNNLDTLEKIKHATLDQSLPFQLNISKGRLFFYSQEHGRLLNPIEFSYQKNHDGSFSSLLVENQIDNEKVESFSCTQLKEKGERTYEIKLDQIQGSSIKKVIALFSPSIKSFSSMIQDGNAISLHAQIIEYNGQFSFSITNLMSKNLYQSFHLNSLKGEVCSSGDNRYDLNNLVIQSESFSLEGNGLFTRYDNRKSLITLNAKKAKGDLPTFLKLLQKLSLNPTSKLPVNGTFITYGEGLKIKSTIIDGEWNTDCQINAMISDLSLSEKGSFMLDHVGFLLKYDSEKKFFQIRNATGNASISDQEHFKFRASKIVMSNRLDQFAFDLSLNQENREMIRLVGEGKMLDQSILSLNFTPVLTHFYSLQPELFTIQLKDFVHLHRFEIKHEFKPEEMQSQIEKLSSLGLIKHDPQFSQFLSQLPLSGIVKTHIEYFEPHDRFHFEFIGKNVFFQDEPQGEIRIKGIKSQNKTKFTIDNQDRYSFECVLVNKGDTLYIPSIIAKWDQNRCFFNGNFDLTELKLHGEFTFDQWKLRDQIALYDLSGKLSLALSEQFTRAGGTLSFHGFLRVNGEEASIRSLDSIPFTYTRSGIRAEQICLALSKEKEMGSLKIESLGLMHDQSKNYAMNVDFSFGSEWINPFLANLSPYLSIENSLSGKLNLKGAVDDLQIKGSFHDTTLSLMGYSIPLSAMDWKFVNSSLTSIGEVKIHDLPVSFKGELLLKSSPSLKINLKGENSQELMTLYFGHDHNDHFALKGMKGQLYDLIISMEFDDALSSQYQTALSGKIKLDHSEDPSRSLFKGSPYLFVQGPVFIKGHFFIDHEKLQDSYFDGKLSGNKLSYLTHAFQHVSTFFKCSLQELLFNDISLCDHSCKVHISSLGLKKQPSSAWQVHASSIVVEDLEHLSDSRGVLLYSLTGELFNPPSFTGEGHILADYSLLYHFGDVLSYVGLKLDNLPPYCGQTEFVLKNVMLSGATAPEVPFNYAYAEELLKETIASEKADEEKVVNDSLANEMQSSSEETTHLTEAVSIEENPSDDVREAPSLEIGDAYSHEGVKLGSSE